MPLCGIKIARVYEVQCSSSVPLDDSDSVSTSNCHRQLRVRPRGVEIDPLSVREPILELLRL
jgi:hypothetical protein